MEQRVIDVEGVETNYCAAGPADGEVILLIHGAGTGVDASLWFPWADRLAKRYRVIAPDLLGYGGTRKVVYFDRSAQAQRLEHLVSFCGALELAPAHLVGHSMGGGLVLQIAIDHPALVRRAVTIAGPGGILLDRARMAAIATDEPDYEWAVRACEVGVAYPDDRMVTERLERAQRADHLAVVQAVGVLNRLYPRGEAYEEQFRAALGTIVAPVLVLSGDEDPFTITGWEEELASLIPSAHTVSYAGGRHEPHRSHPEQAAVDILEFLGAVEDPSPEG